ncbi:PH-domain-containing protein [Coprinopsis marcescibilis]|uniref:PH-domain-containing protein n=1 Tax=Coprinopsis marcescibilis TaxID=230819 RepID=A0A5C3L461_COPMA|nr:PH-domain-containing protein [Coprinopsis marcescibilis]
MPPAAVPPSPQEIQRKLSVHSASKPPKPTLGHVSGTESDSDSIQTPDVLTGSLAHSGFQFGTPTNPPLSSIAERSPVSGEDTDEEDAVEGGWRTPDLRRPRNNVDESVIKSGYLIKKGERRKTWKKRWFVLRPAHLAYYKSSEEYQTLKLLDLSDVHSCTPVNLKRHDNTFSLISPHRTFYFQASSPQDVREWVTAIEDARQALLATSTRNSASTPIPIINRPEQPTQRGSSLAISTSPGQLHPITSSDSEDGGYRGAPSPTAINFAPSPSIPSAPQPKVIISGYLMKLSSHRRKWQKRWFVLTSEKLVYSQSHMDPKPTRTVPFSAILDALEYQLPQGKHPQSSSPPGVSAVSDGDDGARSHTFKIAMTKNTLLLCAPSEEDEIRWLGAIRALIARRSGSGLVPGELTKSATSGSGHHQHHHHQAVEASDGGATNNNVPSSSVYSATTSPAAKSKTRRQSVSGSGGGGSGGAVVEAEARDTRS